MTKTTEAKAISYHNESGHAVPLTEGMASDIASAVLEGENRHSAGIELVYTDENGIVEINKMHLHRDYVTDVISYYYHESDSAPVEGTIFCCAQRISEQAVENNVPELQEFARVLIHGMLHLCGHVDTEPEQKSLMTQKEDEYLTRLRFL